MEWLVARVGITGARIIAAALLVSLLLVIGFSVARCTRKDDAGATVQAEQTQLSSDAIANAAQAAVETIGNRTADDAVIDHATEKTMENVNEAVDAYSIRSAVVAGVCGQASHRSDPACKVR